MSCILVLFYHIFKIYILLFFCRKGWGKRRCGWQWGGGKTLCYHHLSVRNVYKWGAPCLFLPMLRLVLFHSPELWHPLKGPHQSWVHRPELKGHASSIGVPGGRYRVWTWRPAEWARGCCPLHPQWHWWDWTGRSGGPSSHGSSPGPPCWDPGKNSPLCLDGELPGKRRGHPILQKNHFKAFISISSCYLQQTFRGHGPSRWIPPKPPFLKCRLPLPKLWPS